MTGAETEFAAAKVTPTFGEVNPWSDDPLESSSGVFLAPNDPNPGETGWIRIRDTFRFIIRYNTEY